MTVWWMTASSLVGLVFERAWGVPALKAWEGSWYWWGCQGYPHSVLAGEGDDQFGRGGGVVVVGPHVLVGYWVGGGSRWGVTCQPCFLVVKE